MIEPLDDIPGLWPNLRHDRRLTGHQPLPGAIREPAVRWQHRLSGPHFDGALVQHERGADLLLPFGGCLHRFDAAGSLVWKSAALGIESIVAVEDVDNDGRTEILLSNGKSLFVLDALSGGLLWTMYFGPPTAGGFMHTAARLYRDGRSGAGAQLAVGLLSSREVVLLDFSPGASSPRLRRRLSMPDFFHPSLLVLDIDRDGTPELVVTKLSSIYIFDPHTGGTRGECRWTSGGSPRRNYGMFRAIDLDGDNAPEFVAISDRVSRHIAVVDNDGAGGLSMRWDRFIEHIYDSDTTELRASAGSCCDLDGDGRVEIVTSSFNAEGDGRWWLEIADALTGEVRARIADQYVRGVDCIGLAGPTLFLSREVQRVPQLFGEIMIAGWNEERGLLERARFESGRFVGRFAESRPELALFRSDLPPSDDVWVPWIDESPYVAVVTEEEGLLLVAEDGIGLPVSTGMRCPQSIIAVDDLDGDGRTEMVLGDCDGSIWSVQMDGTVLGRVDGGLRTRPGTGPYYAAKPAAVPVVFQSEGRRFCAAPDGGGLVHLLEGADGDPVVRWCLPGRGRVGPEEAYHSVACASVDGEPCVVLASIGEQAVVAVDIKGVERGRWAIPWLPPAEATPNARTGVHEIAPLRVDRNGALLISGFGSWSMNSERTVVLDGATREAIWTSEGGVSVPGHRLGFGPWNAASIALSDGTERILFLAKDTVCEVDAATGLLMHEPWQLRPFNTAAFAELGFSMDDFAAYGSLAVVDVDNDGRDEWVLIANYGGHGVLGRDHDVRWWHAAPLSMHTGAFPGIADVDGDGFLELGIGTAEGEFICLRAATGRELWRLRLGETTTGVASCDIDGDGVVEFVVSTAEGSLFAVGVSSVGTGLVKWRLDLGYALGAPVIADFTGSGSSQILVVRGDGWLCGVA